MTEELATLEPARPAEPPGRRGPGARRTARWWPSAWPPTSPRPSCCGASSTRSARRRTRNWVCVISDDCSTPERFAALQAEVGGRPAVRLSRSPRRLRLLPQLRARAGAGSAGARSTWRWPTRTTAGTRTSSRRCSARSATRSWSTATRGSSTPDGELVADTYWSHAPQQPHRHHVAAGGQLGHRRRVAVPARAARLRAALPARPSSPTSTTTGSPWSRWRWATSPSSTGRCTTTSSTTAPCSATPPPTA